MTQTADICIIGGNIAGLLLARRLAARLPDAAIRIFDSGVSAVAGKTIVIDRRAADSLAQLNALPSTSHPIHQVDVSVAACRHTVGGGDTPLGYSIIPEAVMQRLRGDLTITQTRITGIATDNNYRQVTLTEDNGTQTTARLLIISCPLPSLPPPFRTRRLPYQQAIFSFAARTALPANRACQRFSRRRVYVLVPRADSEETGVIICAPVNDAGTLTAMPDRTLSAELSREFNLSVQVHGRRFCYNPALISRTPLYSAPIILLGGGATTLHPIGAQAISLAVKDAEQLAAAIGDSPAPDLQDYSRRRTRAHRAKAGLTSLLALGAFGAGGLF